MSGSSDEFTRKIREQAILAVPCPRDYCAARVRQQCNRPGGRAHLGRIIDAAAHKRELIARRRAVARP